MLKRIVFISLLLLSLAGGVVVYFATVNGPLGYSDSVEYIVSARNLIKGIGFGMFYPSGRFVVTYLHPPLYSLLLSGIGIFGIDLVDAARWLNIVLCIATVFLAGFVFLRFSRIPETALLAGMLTLFFPTTLEMFTSAMSEGLFLFQLISSCFLLLHYFQRPTIRSLVITALSFGLLPLTRYVGVAYILSVAMCVFLFSTGSWKERLKESLLFGVIASLPILIWFIVLYFGPSRGLGGRSIGADWGKLLEGFYFYRDAMTEILWAWIPFSRRSAFEVLYRNRYIFFVVSFLLVSAVTWLSWRRLTKNAERQGDDPDVQIAVFFGTGVLSYLLVFTANWLFTNPQPDIINRLLMPVYFGIVLGLLGCWAVIQRAWFSSTNWSVRLLPWVWVILSVYWFSPQMVDVINLARENRTPLAYRWEDSQIIQAIEKLPADQKIVANRSETIQMWADRPAYDLFEYLQPEFVKGDGIYGSDDADDVQGVFRDGATLVILDGFTDEFEATYGLRNRDRVTTIFDGLVVVGRYPEGVIYLYPDE